MTGRDGRARASTTGGAPSTNLHLGLGADAGSVRRDLFASQLTRRGPHAHAQAHAHTHAHAPLHSSNLAENAGGSSSIGSGLGLAASTSEPTARQQLHHSLDGDGSEIVVRDSRTEMVLDPSALVLEDQDEVAAVDERQEHEKERQRLAEAVKQHQITSTVPDKPEELLEAVRESLRAKVAALAEDNWMYEGEKSVVDLYWQR